MSSKGDRLLEFNGALPGLVARARQRTAELDVRADLDWDLDL